MHYNPYFVSWTYAVHGYLYDNALYTSTGYANLLAALNNNKPSNATNLEKAILVIHKVESGETKKYAFGADDGIYAKYVEYSDVSEVPNDAEEIYVINYKYIVKDSLGRYVDQTIDLQQYQETYEFIEKVRQDMFFGPGSGEPPASTIWAWKAQGGVQSGTYKYYLPTALFDAFISDVATYYNLTIASEQSQTALGLQNSNFIVYFPNEEKSYNCWVSENKVDVTDNLTNVSDIYLTNFSYADDGGNLVSLDISDFVASLPSDSPYLERLEELDSSVLR